MKIDKLLIGTKLMWDAPKPYEGYRAPNTLDDSKILYTAIVSERDKDAHPRGTKIKTIGSSNWMGSENTFLRFPTEEELENYKWPEI